MPDVTPTPNSPSPSVFFPFKERWLILFLCVFAAFHVFIFSAAFPFFNNVDEQFHFDQVVKYSHLQIPQKPDNLSDESMQYIVVFSTWEYLLTKDTLYAPPWKQAASEITPVLVSRETRWQTINREYSQPPLYYLIAGVWWRLCGALGFHDGFLLYLLHFLNALLISAVVLTGWLAAKVVFPENIFVRIGVPALLAFMPQTTFYCISSDVLSPLCFGLVFVCLLHFWRAEMPDIPLGIFTGLALAATFLAKMTNLPLLAVSSVLILLKILQLVKSGKLKSSLPSLAALFICAGLPAALWMAWCKCFYGDFTGSAARVQVLNWTVKPFSQWWHHPIFTPFGVWTYLSGQLATFWQGEFLWHNQPLVLPGTNFIYTVLSLLLVVTVLPALFPKFSKVTPLQCDALQFGMACFVAELGFFAMLSTVYDYHVCINPSREHPYFQAGRMILGALIPFSLLLVYGLDRLLNRFGTVTKFAILAFIVFAMLALEIATDWPVFSSQYNWYHM
jgi:hypothetical protein